VVKRIKKVIKEKPTRQRKKLIVIGTEGDNKTETLYFRELEKTQSQYHFVFANGNETDPIKIVENTAKRAKVEELEKNHGDFAISVFDLDADSQKQNQLRLAKEIAEKKEIIVITSNPCFEVWYLEHFDFSSKPFLNSHAVVSELEKKIPRYKKESACFTILYPNTERAISNCEKLIRYHERNGLCDEFSNPRTDVYRIARLFAKSKNKEVNEALIQ